MRLIDADALVADRSIQIVIGAGDNICVDIADIKKAPTIEAEPVRHGRCDFCKDGKSFIRARLLLGNDGKWHEIKYCPNCGAKMGGDDHAVYNHVFHRMGRRLRLL